MIKRQQAPLRAQSQPAQTPRQVGRRSPAVLVCTAKLLKNATCMHCHWVVCPGQPSAFHHAEPCRHHQACCSEPPVLRCCALQASAPSASLPTPESSSVPGLISMQQPQQKLQLPVQAAARPQQQHHHQSLYSTGLGPSTGASEAPTSEADLLSGSLHTLSSGAGSMPQPIGPPAASVIAHSSQGNATGSSGKTHDPGKTQVHAS